MDGHPAVQNDAPTVNARLSPANVVQKRAAFRMVSLKQERLTRKVALAFGFMSFIPLLLVFWAFVSIVSPNIQGPAQDVLRLVMLVVIASIFIGYFVLKYTMRKVMEVVQQARQTAEQSIGEPLDLGDGDEIGELARAFNRITSELQQKIDALESSRALVKRLLSRIGTAIVSYESVDNILELIIENASTALEAQMGSLLLVDGEKHELEVKTAWCSDGQFDRSERLTFPRMRMGEGIAGWVAKENAPMRATGSPAAVGLVTSRVKEGAVLCVPLIIREKTIGAFAVLREDASRQFAEDEKVLLANIALQIAVAIENYRLNLDMEYTYLETITALAMAVEAKEPYTAGHSKRVGYYAVQIAEALGLDDEMKRMLQHAGLLHDIGKIGIKDDILLKPASLTPEEWRVMQQHSVIGEAILKPVRSLAKVAEIVRCHHERYDGSGYPDGIKGEKIPLAARILVVADSYDAMATDRPYRKRLSLQEAIAELRDGSGTQFDPKAVEAFIPLLLEKEQRQRAHSDPRPDTAC